MATFTQQVSDRFPPGTVVAAYLQSNWAVQQLPPSGAPQGASAGSATVAADGTLTITGLTVGAHYFLTNTSGTPGNLGYLSYNVPAAAAGGGAVSSVFTRTGAVVAAPGDYAAADVTNAADKAAAGAQTFTGELVAPDLKPSGLTGATAASRYVGATASGAPASGTFAVGDFVIDRTGKVWVCTAAGTPGTWATVGAATSFPVIDWPLVAGSYLSNMRLEDAGTTSNAPSNQRLSVGRLPYTPGTPITKLSFVPAAAMAALTNQWACVIDAKTKTILAVSADGTTTALANNTAVSYTMGAAYTPAAGDVLAWGLLLAGTVPNPSMRGRQVTAGGPNYGAQAFPAMAVVSAGNGSAVTTPMAVSAVLGTLTQNGQIPYVEVG